MLPFRPRIGEVKVDLLETEVLNLLIDVIEVATAEQDILASVFDELLGGDG